LLNIWWIFTRYLRLHRWITWNMLECTLRYQKRIEGMHTSITRKTAKDEAKLSEFEYKG
jgi:hypothetical protein